MALQLMFDHIHYCKDHNFTIKNIQFVIITEYSSTKITIRLSPKISYRYITNIYIIIIT